MRRLRFFFIASAIGIAAVSLGSCIKKYLEVDTLQVTNFKPDIVLPLAEVDSVSVLDMVFKKDYEKHLDAVKLDGDGSIVYSRTIHCPVISSITSEEITEIKFETLKKLANLSTTAEDWKKIGLSGFDGKLKSLTFKAGAKLKANKAVTIEKLIFKKGTVTTVKEDIKISEFDSYENLEITIEEPKDKVLFEVEFNSQTSKGAAGEEIKDIDLGLDSLLDCNVDLTNPTIKINAVRYGIAKNEGVEFWVTGFKVNDEVKAGTDEDKLPFNKEKKERAETLPAGDNFNKEYSGGMLKSIVSTNVKSVNSGTFHLQFPDRVSVQPGETTKIEANVIFRVPLEGKFNSLIKEFNVGGGESTLPDLNEMLIKGSDKVQLKSKFDENDSVKLHFYFKNSTPLDLFVAAKIGKNDLNFGEPINITLAGGVKDKALKKNSALKIGDFTFYKLVESPEIDEDTKRAKEKAYGEKSVTVNISYEDYNNARGGEVQNKIVGLMLLRSPEGKVVKLSKKDCVKIRLGVEVKTEQEIELKK